VATESEAGFLREKLTEYQQRVESWIAKELPETKTVTQMRRINRPAGSTLDPPILPQRTSGNRQATVAKLSRSLTFSEKESCWSRWRVARLLSKTLRIQSLIDVRAPMNQCPKEFNSKLLPFLQQSVPLEDGVEFARVQNSGFYELQNAGEILGAAGSKRYGHQMLSGDHPGTDAFHLVSTAC